MFQIPKVVGLAIPEVGPRARPPAHRRADQLLDPQWRRLPYLHQRAPLRRKIHNQQTHNLSMHNAMAGGAVAGPCIIVAPAASGLTARAFSQLKMS